MKLSIVVPVYNGETFISASLQSLLDQAEQNFEVVVVDDGSTDGSAAAAERMLAESSLHFQVLIQKNAGVSAARNNGLREAKGEYVIFLDCDDLVSPKLVEKVFILLSRNQPDVICYDRRDAGSKAAAEEKSAIKPFSMNGIEALQSILREERMKICTGSAAYRKAFLEAFHLQYTEGCRNGEDQEFHYKLLSHAEHVMYLKEELMLYVTREGSISNSYAVQRFDSIPALYRAAAYMKDTGHPQLKELALLLKEQKVIINYFYNLQGCLAHFEDGEIQQLLPKIDERYPGLNEQVRKEMKSYSGRDKKLQWKIRLFLLSPSLYRRVSKLAG